VISFRAFFQMLAKGKTGCLGSLRVPQTPMGRAERRPTTLVAGGLRIIADWADWAIGQAV
ncbi:MAG: hypothetical protein AAFX51_11095, partial [Cyanobacteria bacterium J06636_28]